MKRFESGSIFVSVNERIELTADETSIINTMSILDGHYGRLAIINLLKQHCNADRVWRVLELRNKPLNACYTLAPIIQKIGDRTPEQYIADVDAAVERFNCAYQEYMSRFGAAKTEKQRIAASRWWMDYLWSIK